MLTLYIREGCPFCEIVLAKIKYLDLKIEIKNIGDEEALKELIALGSKKQAPYFIDHEHNIEMYESHEINKYLGDNYGSPHYGIIEEIKENKPPQVCTLE